MDNRWKTAGYWFGNGYADFETIGEMVIPL
jgi:hypothetical protein